jgi:hypothetical protein
VVQGNSYGIAVDAGVTAEQWALKMEAGNKLVAMNAQN